MRPTFWTNTIWYLLLLFSSIVAAVVTYKNSHNRSFTVLFSLAVLGFTYWIEVTLVMIFGAYTYHPMITPDDPFFDTVLGNMFSQISITTTAVMVCTLHVKNIYIPIFALFYFFLDVLFSHLGIYVHNWYRSAYTLIGFMPLLWLIRQWYRMLVNSATKSKWLKNPTLFLAAFAAGSNTLLTSMKWMGLQVFHIGIFPEMSKDHTATALVYGPALIAIYMVLRRRHVPRMVKAISFVALFLIQYVLHRMGFIIIPPGWFPVVAALDLFGFYFWVAYLMRLLEKSNLPGVP